MGKSLCVLKRKLSDNENEDEDDKTNRKKQANNEKNHNKTHVYNVDNIPANVHEVLSILGKHNDSISLKNAKLKKIFCSMAQNDILLILNIDFNHEIFTHIANTHMADSNFVLKLLKININAINFIHYNLLSDMSFVNELIKFKYNELLLTEPIKNTLFNTLIKIIKTTITIDVVNNIIVNHNNDVAIINALLRNTIVNKSYKILCDLAKNCTNVKVLIYIITIEMKRSPDFNYDDKPITLNLNTCKKLIDSIYDTDINIHPYFGTSILGYIIYMYENLFLEMIISKHFINNKKNVCTFHYEHDAYDKINNKIQSYYFILKSTKYFVENGDFDSHYDIDQLPTLKQIPFKYSNNNKWINKCALITNDDEVVEYINANVNNAQCVYGVLSSVKHSGYIRNNFSLSFLKKLPVKVLTNAKNYFNMKLDPQISYGELKNTVFDNNAILLNLCKNNLNIYLTLPSEHELKNNTSLINKISHHENIFRSLNDEQKTLSVCLNAVSNSNLYLLLNDEMKNNKEICYNAIKKNPHIMKYVPKAIKSDFKLAHYAVSKNKNVFEYISPELACSIKFVIAVIKNKFTYSAQAVKKLLYGFPLNQINSRRLYNILSDNHLNLDKITNIRIKDYPNKKYVKENLYTLMIILALGHKHNKYLQCGREIRSLKYVFSMESKLIEYLD
jgi:hypothetical protein